MTATDTPTTGNLLYTDVEGDLRSSVRALLDKTAPWSGVLARTETAETADPWLWSALADQIGCTALAVPEEHGGAGVTWREAAVIAEELGRAVAPVPFLGHSIAIALLLEVGHHDLLTRLAADGAVGVLATPFSAIGPGYGAVESRAGELTGSISSIADCDLADVFLVPASGAIWCVQGSALGLSRSVVGSLDMTRPVSDLTLDGVDARIIAVGDAAASALAYASHIGAVLLASEQLGVAEKCFEMTVEYLSLRRQFGRTLSSFQALKHRLADLWVSITQARAVARYAAECAATGSPDLPVAAALAQAHCSIVVQRVAEESLQLHGGIGFTWEHPVHLYLKRAKSSAVALGGSVQHRASLGNLVDLATGN